MAVSIEPQQTSTRRRKTNTLLFAALVGTGDEAQSAAVWPRLIEVIEQHGGKAERRAVDRLFAVWDGGLAEPAESPPGTAPLVAEETIQAINAALKLREEVASLAPSLALQIGIHTGAARGLGGISGQEVAPGSALAIVMQLQAAAPVGGILISHETYRYTVGVFDVSPREPQAIDGRKTPLLVYLVEKRKEYFFHIEERRSLEGVETRMVGRDAEMQRLQEMYFEVMQTRKLRFALITGAVGIGKSRLLHEFDLWSELRQETFYYFSGRSDASGQSLPYALLRNLFAYRFSIQENDPRPVVWQKMEQGMALAGENRETVLRAHVIGQLLGFDFQDSPHLAQILGGSRHNVDARQLHDRALVYMLDYFKALADQQPVEILLEDLHWADDSSLDVMEYLATRLADLPLLIYAAARSDFLARRPNWGDALHKSAGFVHLELKPLLLEDCVLLVDEILQKMDRVPENLRTLLSAHSGGNPFYIEELVRTLIDDGVIIKGEEHWSLNPERTFSLHTPPTLSAILRARFDHQPAAERSVLQRAAVFGQTFWDRGLEYLAGASEVDACSRATSRTLTALYNQEMIFPQASSTFVNTREYCFKHTMLRETAYASLSDGERRAYHARAAEWLRLVGGPRAGELAAVIAGHLLDAGLIEEAVDYLQKAGERAALQFAHAEAAACFTRALDLLFEMDYVRRFDLLLARERVYDAMGQRSAQHQDLLDLAEVAENLGLTQQVEVTLRQANYAYLVSDYPGTITAASRATEWARMIHSIPFLATGYFYWGRALWRKSDYVAARTQLLQSLGLARQAQLQQLEADCLRTLGLIADFRGEHSQARDFFEQALVICQDTSDCYGETLALNNLGDLYIQLGDYPQARQHLEKGLQIARQTGDRFNEALVLNTLGDAATQQGDYIDALNYFEAALQTRQAIGDRQGEANVIVSLGSLSFELGLYTPARDHFEQALKIYRQIGERRGESLALNQVGRTLRCLGDYTAAYTQHAQALKTSRELGSRRFEGAILTALGHTLAAMGRRAEAAGFYLQALDVRREMKQLHLRLDALAGLARLSLAQGNTVQAREYISEPLEFLKKDSALGSIDEPFWVHLTIVQVLQATQDRRMQPTLAAAQELLKERAMRISDHATRRSYLENVPYHRQLLAMG